MDGKQMSIKTLLKTVYFQEKKNSSLVPLKNLIFEFNLEWLNSSYSQHSIF